MLKEKFLSLKTRLEMFDLTILVFILLMSQDRIVVKLAAIAFIFAFRFNFRFGLRDNRLPLFYLAIVLVEIVKWLVMGNLYLGNWATLLVSSLYWGLAFLTMHQVKLSVERNDISKSENTIKLFTALNFLVCFFQLIKIMIVTGSINPYSVSMFAPDIRFPDVLFPYGQSSGDQIRGVFYDNHHNALISQFCFVFFIYNRRYLFAALNFFIIGLICFNLVTLTTMFICFILFFLLREKTSRLFIASCFVAITLFYAFVTPENVGYLTSRIKSSFSSVMSKNEGLVTESREVTEMENDTLASQETDSIAGTVHAPAKKVTVVDSSYNIDQVSGKKISYFQTFRFLRSDPVYMIAGGGAGTFSSKLANNFSGVFYGPTFLNRHLPAPTYDVFKLNHGSLNKYLQKLEIGKHSINNFPNSVYNQLLSEYGFLGLLLFAVFYVFYFIKRHRSLTYGLILLPLLLIGFNYGYYFESLDISVFFEFMMFLNLKQKAQNL